MLSMEGVVAGSPSRLNLRHGPSSLLNHKSDPELNLLSNNAFRETVVTSDTELAEEAREFSKQDLRRSGPILAETTASSTEYAASWNESCHNNSAGTNHPLSPDMSPKLDDLALENEGGNKCYSNMAAVRSKMSNYMVSSILHSGIHGVTQPRGSSDELSSDDRDLDEDDDDWQESEEVAVGCLDLSASRQEEDISPDQQRGMSSRKKKRKQTSPQHMGEGNAVVDHEDDRNVSSVHKNSQKIDADMQPPPAKVGMFSEPQKTAIDRNHIEAVIRARKSAEELKRARAYANDLTSLLTENDLKDMSTNLKEQLTTVIDDTIQQTIQRIREVIKLAVAVKERSISAKRVHIPPSPPMPAPTLLPESAFNPHRHAHDPGLRGFAPFHPPSHLSGSSTPRSLPSIMTNDHISRHLASSQMSVRCPPQLSNPPVSGPEKPCLFYPVPDFPHSRFFEEEALRHLHPQFPCLPPPLPFYNHFPPPPMGVHPTPQTTHVSQLQNQQNHFTTKKDEQTEALPLVVSSAPKRKRTKVTDTRLSPRTSRSMLAELARHPSSRDGLEGNGHSEACYPLGYPTVSPFHSEMLAGMFPGVGDVDRSLTSPGDRLSPSCRDSLSRSSPCRDQMDSFDKMDDISQTSTLTPVHLRKAKLMFFYTRYPSSSILKAFFPDVRFNKNNTAQLVKWFSNFREFYYIQMEKYARMAITEGIKDSEDIHVTLESEIFRVLNLHYNRNNQIDVPDHFRVVLEATLREFFNALFTAKDHEQSWKKPIYKVIARMDQTVPEFFKSLNWVEQLVDN